MRPISGVMARSRLPAAVTISALLAGATATAVSPELRHQIEISFVRQPARYTELYFERPDALPRATDPMKPTMVGFTIHNHEGKEVSYQYIARFAGVAGSFVIGRGQIAITEGSAGTRTVELPTGPSDQRFTLAVELAGRPESIQLVGVGA